MSPFLYHININTERKHGHSVCRVNNHGIAEVEAFEPISREIKRGPVIALIISVSIKDNYYYENRDFYRKNFITRGTVSLDFIWRCDEEH